MGWRILNTGMLSTGEDLLNQEHSTCHFKLPKQFSIYTRNGVEYRDIKAGNFLQDSKADSMLYPLISFIDSKDEVFTPDTRTSSLFHP